MDSDRGKARHEWANGFRKYTVTKAAATFAPEDGSARPMLLVNSAPLRAEIMRLAEEVEQLKAVVALNEQAVEGFATGPICSRAALTAKIRRELRLWGDEQEWLAGEEEDAFDAALDRLLPEEG